VLLGAAIPGTGIGRKPAVKAVIGPERIHQGGLVIWRAPHPAVRHARPLGDRIPLRDEFLPRTGRTEELVRIATRAGIGRPSQNVLGLGGVQRVVEARDRARGVAERRRRGHVLDALAVDLNVTPITQACEIFRARERTPFGCNDVLGLHRPLFLAYAAPWHSRSLVSMRRPLLDQPRSVLPAARFIARSLVLSRRPRVSADPSAPGHALINSADEKFVRQDAPPRGAIVLHAGLPVFPENDAAAFRKQFIARLRRGVSNERYVE